MKSFNFKARINNDINTRYNFAHDNIVEMKREMFYISQTCMYL